MRIGIDLDFGKLLVSHEKVASNNMSRTHNHSDYEIYYLREGERYIFAGDLFYSARAGDIFIIPPEIPHRTISAGGSEEYVRVALNIPAALFPKDMQSLNSPHFIRSSGEQREILERVSSEIEDCLLKRPAGQSAVLLSLVTQMMAVVLSDPQNSEETLEESTGRMAEIIAYVDQHYTEPITLLSLSKKFYISEYYLCRRFKEYTGRTFVTYLTDMRISRAKWLLINTGEQIKTVSRLAGFGSVSAFGSAFRAIEGISPLAYRKNLQTTATSPESGRQKHPSD